MGFRHAVIKWERKTKQVTMRHKAAIMVIYGNLYKKWILVTCTNGKKTYSRICATGIGKSYFPAIYVKSRFRITIFKHRWLENNFEIAP